MIVKLLTEHHLEFLSLKVGCRGSSVSTLVKMSNCWKSHALAPLTFKILLASRQNTCLQVIHMGRYRSVTLHTFYWAYQQP